MAIASPDSSDWTTKEDKRPGPLRVSDRVMTCHDLLGWQISRRTSLFFKKKGGGGHAVHSMEHIVVCSAMFGKVEAVQEYVRKEDK